MRAVRAVAAVASAALTGVWIAWVTPPAVSSTMPAETPGLVELALMAAATAGRTTPVDALVGWADAALLPLALVSTVGLAWGVTGRWLPACAAALAATVTSVRIGSAHLLPAAFSLIAVSTLWALLRPAPRATKPSARQPPQVVKVESEGEAPPANARGGPRAAWPGLFGLLATSMAMPQLAALAALLGVWHTATRVPGSGARRGVLALMAGAAILAGAAGVVWLVPPLPTRIHTPASAPLQAQAPLLAPGGLLGVGLAALGLFVLGRSGLVRAHSVALAYAVGPFALRWLGTSDGDRIVAPLAALFVVLVAAGLSEIVRACRVREWGAVAAGCFVVLVPLRAASEARLPARPASIEAAGPGPTLDQFTQAHRALPYHSVLVVGDAISDLLLRASAASLRRAGKVEAVVDADADAVSGVLRERRQRVFAWSKTPDELRRRGVRAQNRPELFMPGAAELTTGGRCASVGHDWMTLDALAASAQFTLIAETAEERGPILLYAAADEPVEAAAIDWPLEAQYGFRHDRYRTTDPAERAALEATATADGLSAASAIWSRSHVTRFMLWRTPDAPRQLRVGTRVAPPVVVAKMDSAATPPRLTVCPAFF